MARNDTAIRSKDSARAVDQKWVFGFEEGSAQMRELLGNKGANLGRGIFARSPFETIDVAGVGSLVKMAADAGRAANPGLTLGICGEHGGDPASIAFFGSVPLDYVSCSPFRVPIARVAAAQAAS